MGLPKLPALGSSQVQGRRQNVTDLPAAELIIEIVVRQPGVKAGFVDSILVHLFEQLSEDASLVVGIYVFEVHSQMYARLDCWIEGFDAYRMRLSLTSLLPGF